MENCWAAIQVLLQKAFLSWLCLLEGLLWGHVPHKTPAKEVDVFVWEVLEHF